MERAFWKHLSSDLSPQPGLTCSPCLARLLHDCGSVPELQVKALEKNQNEKLGVQLLGLSILSRG